MVFLLTQCATSIVFCLQSKIKLLLVWKLLLVADTKCLLCLSFSNLFFMPKTEKSIAILAFYLLLFMKPTTTELSQCALTVFVGLCTPVSFGILHPSHVRGEVVCRVSDPGDAYTALGTCAPFRFGFSIEFNVELNNPQLLVTWMRPTKSIFSILFLF